MASAVADGSSRAEDASWDASDSDGYESTRAFTGFPFSPLSYHFSLRHPRIGNLGARGHLGRPSGILQSGGYPCCGDLDGLSLSAFGFGARSPVGNFRL